RIMQKATPVRFAKTEKICLANCGKNETTASTAACALSLTAILLPIRINQMIKYLAISSDQTKDMLKAYLKTTSTNISKEAIRREITAKYSSILLINLFTFIKVIPSHLVY